MQWLLELINAKLLPVPFCSVPGFIPSPEQVTTDTNITTAVGEHSVAPMLPGSFLHEKEPGYEAIPLRYRASITRDVQITYTLLVTSMLAEIHLISTQFATKHHAR